MTDTELTIRQPFDKAQDKAQDTTSTELIKRDHATVAATIYRYTDIAFQRGEGVYLYDFEDRKYLDFVAGIATMNVGHCHPAVVEAICDQARTLIQGASHVGYMEPYVDMLESLKTIAPGDLKNGKGILMNSGSEAVETGIKLARYVTNRSMILAFTESFHGRAMGALALTASNTIYRQRLTGLFTGVYHTPYPYCYRCPLKHESPEPLRFRGPQVPGLCGRHRHHERRTLSPGRGGGHLRPSPHSHPRRFPRGLHGALRGHAGVTQGRRPWRSQEWQGHPNEQWVRGCGDGR